MLRQRNENFPYTGYVSPPVWCRDLASCASREQETDNISNAVPAGHPWAHTVGQAKNVVILKQVGEVPVKEQLKQRRLQ